MSKPKPAHPSQRRIRKPLDGCICGRGCGDCPVHDVLPSDANRAGRIPVWRTRMIISTAQPPLAVFKAWAVTKKGKMQRWAGDDFAELMRYRGQTELMTGKPIRVKVTVEEI